MSGIRLNIAGIAAVLKSEPVRQMVDEAAAGIAETVRANPNITRHAAEVVTESYTTDRAAAVVLVKHAAATGIEGKHGVLTAAVRDAGLTVEPPKKGRK